MDSLPLVSIVTPSYNQSQFLEETILSVLSQDYENIEYIIIDGGSTDGSIDIINKYKDKISYWVSEPDSGQSQAINKGWRKSKGEVIGWLNSDDTLLPNTISKVVNYFKYNKDMHLCYGDCYIIDQKSRMLHYWKAGNYDLTKALLTASHIIPQPGSFMRRNVLGLVGELKEDSHILMDLDYWLRLATVGRIGYLNEPTSCMRIHPEAKTRSLHEAKAEDYINVFQNFFSSSSLPQAIMTFKNRSMSMAYLAAAQHYNTAIKPKKSRSCILTGLRFYPYNLSRKICFLFLMSFLPPSFLYSLRLLRNKWRK